MPVRTERTSVLRSRLSNKGTHMKVLIVYHSVYGHIQAIAKAIQEGAQGVAGSEVVLRRVQEFPDIVQHMEAEKGYSYQVYQSQASVPGGTVDDLLQADGVVFGSPSLSAGF